MTRLSAALSLLLVFGLAPVAAQEPPVPVFTGGGVSQEAWLDWIELDGDRGTWYVVAGARRASTDGVGTFGFLLTGRCKVDRAKHWTSVFCNGRGRERELASEDFRFDPMLETASVRIEDGGRVHRVEWTGVEPGPEPSTSQGTYVSPWGSEAAAGAGLYRWAEASGRAFGRPVRSGGSFSMSYLGETVGGGVFALTGDLVPLSRTIRIPR